METTQAPNLMNATTFANNFNLYHNNVRGIQITRSSGEDVDLWLKQVIFQIRMCLLPIIAAGTITNAFNFVILSRKDMTRLSTSVYLFALAVADLGVMYFELFRVWFEWVDIVDPDIYFTDTYCKIVNYTNGVIRDFSNWLIACLTLERLVMVASPYKAKAFCTVKRAKTITVCLFFIICLPHVHSLVFSVAQHDTWWVCWEAPDNLTADTLAAIVEFTVGYTVVIVVFILNLSLVMLIYRNKLPVLSGSGANGKRVSTNRRLTRTLLLVAIVFLVGETPRIIMSFICRFLERTPIRRVILNISFVISGINHASNFFIYIMASPRFRHHTLRMLPFSLISRGKSSKRRLSTRQIARNGGPDACVVFINGNGKINKQDAQKTGTCTNDNHSSVQNINSRLEEPISWMPKSSV